MKMRLTVSLWLFITAAITGQGPDSIKLETLKQGPPSSLAPEVQRALNGQGYRILEGQGRNFAEIWLRKSIPSSEKPTAPKGAIQFPFLADGELLGILQFATEG